MLDWLCMWFALNSFINSELGTMQGAKDPVLNTTVWLITSWFSISLLQEDTLWGFSKKNTNIEGSFFLTRWGELTNNTARCRVRVVVILYLHRALNLALLNWEASSHWHWKTTLKVKLERPLRLPRLQTFL